ncbi:DUF4340 domain-containing protein [Anaerotruncus rubiinfantis]|uniref:DUF4340 domain-containing protein n=1 Tax=Anaerotruncus rubiinfantis TaxID=1720200 RepID=UPI00189C02CF
MIRGARSLWGMAAAAVVLLILTAVLAMAAPADEKTAPARENVYVAEIPMQELYGMALKNGNGSMGIALENGVPALLDAPDRDFSAQKLMRFLRDFSSFPARRVTQPLGPEEYGLDTPSATLSVLLRDGTTLRFLLGDRCPMGDGSYLMQEGQDGIYLIDKKLADRLCASMDDFRDFTLFPGLDRDTLANLETIAVERADSTYLLDRLPDAQVPLFMLRDPFEATLEWSAVDEKILAPLQTLEADGFVSQDIPLEAYGLDRPELALHLIYDGKVVSVGFAKAGDGRYYCADLSGTRVLSCGAQSVQFLETGYAELFAASAYHASAAETQNITVTASGLRLSIDLNGEGEDLRGQCGEKTFSQMEMTKLFSRLTAYPILRELPTDTNLPAEGGISVSVTGRDGHSDIIRLLALGQEVAVVINGQANFSTYPLVLEEIESALRHALQ